MIKFFRKIRYDLMEKKKTGKYLKYAIGEIILVVIGILIALQLNNYNESLNQSNQELKALNNLKLDFKYNESELNKSIIELKEINNACFTILNQTGNKHEETFDIDSLLQFTPSVPQYFPQNGFLMDLMNSGNLGIIKNDKLRYKLSSWLPALETLKNRENLTSKFDDILIIYIIKNGSWLNSDEKSSDKEINALKFPKSGFEINNNDLLQNIEFENLIENQIVYKSQLLDNQIVCLELIREIIMLLESETNE
ncbi:DUF6090 family protein [Psychroserpens ponticola]|uniref:DUF6090 family protein n=1 Tax=Psychroserpens ponticola TaxID=2932268 RepID=A0ABY7RWB9_9FLAO|nr:DUF6090 family protein [Psychroserpens ponticola]WCO01052.1 DUF6090 family protein [Psychroserpens ponticola]